MRHRLISFCYSVFPLVLASCGDGESGVSNESAWTRAERLNPPLGDSQAPKVSVSEAGAVVVWSQDDGEHPSVFASHYDAKSRTWGEAILLEENDVDESGGATVALDSKGNAIAVWWQYDGIPLAHLVASYYRASDKAWEPPERIDLSSDGDSRTPSVAMNGAGDAMIVWSQRDDGNRFKVYATYRPHGGKSWTKAESISLENDVSAFNPQIVLDASGHAIAAWEQYSDASHIFAAHYDGMWGEPIAVDSDGDAWGPSLASAVSGNAVVAWHQFVDEVSVVHAARFDVQDGTWTAPYAVSQAVTNAYHPTVTIGEANDGLIVWTQENDDTSLLHVLGAYFDSDMNWRAAQRLGTLDRDESSPEVLMLGSDVVLAAWKQRRETGSPIGDLLTNCYDVDADTWGSPQVIARQQASADLAGDPNLGAIVVWDQNLDIYAARHPPASTPCVR